jgi:hypothetical protein
VTAESLRALERIDAVGAAVRARLLAAFDAQQGSVGDRQRTTRTWLVNCLRITKGQAGEYKAILALATKHEPLLAALRDKVLTKSVALQVARWTKAIPEEFRNGPRRSWSPPRRPGWTCAGWRRSARRSASAPPARTPMMTRMMIRGWTGRCRWIPRWTVSGSCAGT